MFLASILQKVCLALDLTSSLICLKNPTLHSCCMHCNVSFRFWQKQLCWQLSVSGVTGSGGGHIVHWRVSIRFLLKQNRCATLHYCSLGWKVKIMSSVRATGMVSWWERTCCAPGRKAKTRAQVISFDKCIGHPNCQYYFMIKLGWTRWQWRSTCMSPGWGRDSSAGWGHFLGPGLWQVQKMKPCYCPLSSWIIALCK